MPLQPAPIALLATALLAPTGCFWAGSIAGSGTETTEERPVDPFTEIKISGLYTLEATVGPERSLTVVADDNIVPLIETTVRNGTLYIDTDGSIRPRVSPVIRVTGPSLESVSASGASEVIATNLTGERFAFNTSGAAKVTLTGRVDALELDVSGAARIAASELTAKTVELDVSGAGKVDVTVTDSLDADVSGAGKVTYGGNPADVHQNVTGAGSVAPR